MKLSALLLSAGLLLLPVHGTAQEVDKTKMSKQHRRTFDATLALYIQEGEDAPRFTCSTTTIAHAGDDYVLLTAGHCIYGDGQAADAKFFVGEDIQDHDLQPIAILKFINTDKLDFALLALHSQKQYPTIRISDKDAPQIEDKVYTVNYSLGLAKQVALGEVASDPMTVASGDGQCAPCEGRYMVHLFNGPGSSGASMIDEKTGEIVGIVELGFNRGTVGTAAESMKMFREFLRTPGQSRDDASPKAQGLQP